MRKASAPSIIRIREIPGDEAVFGSPLPGAAMLEGWSDAGRWRIMLPWPEETRELGWGSESQWDTFVRELEAGLPDVQTPAGIPFAGGWVGFLSYEAMATVERASPRDKHPPEPAAFFARHRAGILIAPDGVPYLFAPGDSVGRFESALAHVEKRDRVEARRSANARTTDSLESGAYERRIRRIREAIRDGDVYQVNLTRSFSIETPCDVPDLYRALTGARPPRSSAFIRGDGWAIASASPEVLLEFDRAGGVAESRPIKGTVRRRGDDRAEIDLLLSSDKDHAEHLMIVDVVRNDLGKVAPPGSVSVPEYRAVRTLERVHHLESTVRAVGLRDVPVSDVLAALAPAASITGAPKRAAVHAIRELEPGARGVYCGAIGTLRPDGASLSVAIRTAVAGRSEVRYHAGGGIVWDSEPAAEDDECRAKSEAFLRYFGAGG